MTVDIIFKTIKTYKNHYVYDRHTNTLVKLDEDEYQELLLVEQGELSCEKSLVIRKYQESGLFTPNVIEKIEHPASTIIEQYMGTRLNQLTLQVTQQCNLRCDYCAFSGIYEKNRLHTSQRMSLETAKKAIDFFFMRNRVLSSVTVGFYGGEPLLEFELIKQCVEYSKSCVEGKRINFNMTTNGTLLTDEIANYLVENDFSLSISLDGSKEEHDANRKFADGSGSFDIVIRNIKRIKRRYPEFINRVIIMTTVNPYMDLGCVIDYFSAEEIFNDKQIMFNTMTEIGLGKELSYDEKFFKIRNYEYIKMLFSLVGKLDDEYISPLFARSRNIKMQKLRLLHNHQVLPPIAHHGGPCLPGMQRLFVRTDGTFFPCERVNDEQNYFRIGALDDGFDIAKMRAILNIGSITESECKKCWNLIHCSLCAGQIEFDTEPTKGGKKINCDKNNRKTLFDLHEMCVLNEFGFDAEARLTE